MSIRRERRGLRLLVTKRKTMITKRNKTNIFTLVLDTQVDRCKKGNNNKTRSRYKYDIKLSY